MNILMENCSQNREGWLEARKGKIGGSAAYDAADIDEKANPMRPWLELMGRAPELDQDMPQLYFGRELEPFVCDEFCRQYVKDNPGAAVSLLNPDVLVGHETLPWASATPDRIVVIDGEECLLQAKTTNARNLGDWEDGACPNRVRAQVLHELGVCGAHFRRSFAAAFIFEPAFRYVEILREQEHIDELFRREYQTYRCFEQRVPPPIKTVTSAKEIQHAFWDGDRGVIDLSNNDHLARMVERYRHGAMLEKEGVAAKRIASSAILELAGGAERVILSEDETVTIVRQEYPELDVKKLKAKNPELHARLMTDYGRQQRKIYPLLRKLQESTDDAASGDLS